MHEGLAARGTAGADVTETYLPASLRCVSSGLRWYTLSILMAWLLPDGSCGSSCI
jgi:hypothetical protein